MTPRKKRKGKSGVAFRHHPDAKIQRQPMVAHLIRATERFNDRLGNQFGAAITYFSFLSMIPIMMVSFAAAGFILASHPNLLEDIFSKILMNVSDPTLASTLKNTINTAVQQRTTVGLVGLGIALYSGVNWMGNLRKRFAPSHGTSGSASRRIRRKSGSNICAIYLADWIINRFNHYAVHYFHRRFRPADDHLRLVSRQHRMVKTGLAFDRSGHLYFCQLSAFLLDFLATASPSSRKKR